ncbi:MAG: protease inhibitor I42 family protein [Candidatus Nitrosocosmicus sp.]
MNNDQNSDIVVKEGDEFKVTCKANRTAGYTLIPQFNKDLIVLIDQRFNAPSPQMLGGSGVYVFTFKALRHGKEVLKIFTKSAQDSGSIINQQDYSIIIE